MSAKQLYLDHLQTRIAISVENLNTLDNDPEAFTTKTIREGEAWCY